MGLRFSLLGFPVAVQPFFLLTAWLIGPRSDLQSSLVWIACVFTGVLAHEFGHAFAARRFGFQPVIILHGFGGATTWRGGPTLGYGRRILLSAAGPAVGIVIGLSTLGLAQLRVVPSTETTILLVSYVIWVNLGWGLLNLLPVLPLDGGHIATAAAEAVFGPRGRTVALVLSLALTVVLALWMMWLGQIWMTILAAVLAISNVQALGWFGRRSAAQPPEHPSADDAERAYAMALSMAAADDVGEALAWLETAIYAGFDDAARLDSDEAWAPLRSHARFQALRRSI